MKQAKRTIIIDEGVTHITQCEEDSITEQELVRVQARIRRAEQVQRSRGDLLQGRLIPEDPDMDIGA
jgi:hypothetical protein